MTRQMRSALPLASLPIPFFGFLLAKMQVVLPPLKTKALRT